MSIRSLAFLFAIMFLSSGTSQATSVRIGTPEPGAVDGTVDVRLYLTPSGNSVGTFQLTVEYDSNCWSTISVAKGAALPSVGTTISGSPIADTSGNITNTDMSYQIIGTIETTANCLAIGTEAEVAILTFTPAADPTGCSGILGWNVEETSGSYECYVLDCNAENRVGLVATDCTPNPENSAPDDTVNLTFVAGTISYFFNSTAVEFCQVKDKTSATPNDVTDSNGKYLLLYTPGVANATIQATRPWRDPDKQAVNAGDLLICRRIAGGTTPSSDQEFVCDMDIDDDIQLDDCTDIETQLLKKFDDRTFQWVIDNDITNIGPPAGSPDTDSGVLTLPKAWDMRAYIRGDCKPSWPTAGKPTAPMPLSLELAGIQSNEVKLVLKADVALEPLETMLFALNYDSNMLEYIGMTPGERAKEFYVNANPNNEPGVLHAVALGVKEAATVSGEMLQLRFRVLNPGRSTITFSELQVNDRPLLEAPSLEIAANEDAISAVPSRYFLSGYPNPFNPAITIEFGIPQSVGSVPANVRILNVAGRHVRTLNTGELTPGFHRVVWNGLDDHGNRVQSGIYFIQAKLGDWNKVYKVTLLK